MASNASHVENLNQNVAIIIPVYNDTVRLKKCLDALACQEAPDFNYRVLVVDNNSTENINAVTAKYDFVTYLHESKPGSYQARNHAIDELKGEQYIGFTDADCIPAKDWIKQAVDSLRENPQAAVGGPVSVFAETDLSISIAEYYEILFAFPQKLTIEKEGFSVTANLFITNEMLRKTGKFNNEVYSGGDYDFGQKLKGSGFAVRYIDSLVIRHPARATLKQLISRIRRCAGGSYQQRNSCLHLGEMFTWRGIIYSFRPPLKEFWRICSTPNLSNMTQFKLCLLSLYLRLHRGAVYVGYKLRLLSRMERF